jgi:predicted nuclease of restriction endonuclease-like (RecB) superfamily
VLARQIEQDLYQRQGKDVTNFSTTLPEEPTRLAGQLLKESYNFDFLTIEPQDIEKQFTCP